MGFKNIYLIGVDCSYSVAESVKQEGKLLKDNGIKQFLESTEDNDTNHFDPRYFGKGKKWHNPNPSKMIEGFTRMGGYASKVGANLINATVGGKLDTLPRVDFYSLFDTSKSAHHDVGYKKLTIIVPVYNCEHYLAESVESIKNSLCGGAVIFVDDGSSDGTLDLLKEYEVDPSIHVVSKSNGGAGSARNVGIEKAISLGTEYILFQDADDFYYPGAVEKLINHLDEHAEIDCVSGYHARVSSKGDFIRTRLSEDTEIEDISLESFLGGPSAMLTATLFRADKISNIRFPEGCFGEDWLYLTMVRANVNKWTRMPELITAYRATQQAINKTSLGYAEKMLGTYSAVKEIVAVDKVPVSEDAKQVEKMAGRLFACGKSEFAKHLIFNNPLGVPREAINIKRLKNRVDFWLCHLEIPAPELYRDIAFKVITGLLEDCSV